MRKLRLVGPVVLVLLPVLAACDLFSSVEHVATTRMRDPGTVTCAQWLLTTARARLDLADRLLGDSPEVSERVRLRQQLPVGTKRDALIGAVAGSLQKNCEAWPPRWRPIDEVFDALYLRPADR